MTYTEHKVKVVVSYDVSNPEKPHCLKLTDRKSGVVFSTVRAKSREFLQNLMKQDVLDQFTI